LGGSGPRGRPRATDCVAALLFFDPTVVEATFDWEIGRLFPGLLTRTETSTLLGADCVAAPSAVAVWPVVEPCWFTGEGIGAGTEPVWVAPPSSERAFPATTSRERKKTATARQRRAHPGK
jgi:hypothetical protein